MVLGVVFCTSPDLFFFFCIAVALTAGFEVARVLEAPVVAPFGLVAITFFPLTEPTKNTPTEPYLSWLPLVLLALGVLGAAFSKHRIAMLFAGLWIGAPLLALICLHKLSGSHSLFVTRAPILLAMVPLWAGDTAAIFAGKAFGKHLLAPTISPKKTVEGSVANLLACIAVSIPLAIWLNYSWATGLACGLCAGILGQAGDLFESALKRRAGVKDSGTLLPGHGGILDRIDSLLFTAPAVAYILLR